MGVHRRVVLTASEIDRAVTPNIKLRAARGIRTDLLLRELQCGKFRFRVVDHDTSVLIRSAGPNGRFDESTAMEFDDFIRSN